MRVLLAACALLCGAAACADEPLQLRIGVYDTAPSAFAHEIEALRPSEFTPAAAPVDLHGTSSTLHWLRLDVLLPPPSDPDERWLLWIERARVDHLRVHVPGGASMPAQRALDFFAPDDDASEHPGGYVFPLPRGLTGPVTLYVEAAAQGNFSLSPAVLTDAQVRTIDADATRLFTAVYTGLLLLLLISLGMYLALRDRLYLQYVIYLVALLVFILAHNGHLYAVPGINAWGGLRTMGLCALANLLAAATVALARQFAGLAQSDPRADRLLALFPAIPLTLALLCVPAPDELAQAVQATTALIALSAMLLAALASAMAWRARRHLALPILLLWLMLFASACVRALVPYGLVPINGWTQYGYQAMAALTAMTLGFALSARLIEFRLQRDRARLAKDQVDASLRLERERRKFVESLNELRDASAADQEWIAFRRLLEALRQLVPQATSAVAVHAFQDNDMLLCEPPASRDAYQDLLATRGGAFKGISRSQLPMQLRIDAPLAGQDDDAELQQFAVIPLPMTTPAWGVLLLERRGWQTFDHEEMQLAAEFVQKATRAVEDAASNRALRRSAEFDALTGAYNRRTMNARLEECFTQALARNTPLVVLFVDLDHLKDINDAHGHAAGDRCLRALAEALSRHCVQVGEFGRYGGDEFVVMLPDLDLEQARRWAESMRADATGQELDFATGTIGLRVSVGVASRRNGDTLAQQLVERADQALYEAKRMGRNRVHVATSREMPRISAPP